MNHRKFFTQLIIITIFSILGILAGNFIPILSIHQSAAWVYLMFFVVFVIGAFVLAKKNINKTGTGHYIRFNISVIFIKMVSCLGIVLAYVQLASPPNNNHALYFILFYIVYSVFEYIVLSKIGYEKKVR